MKLGSCAVALLTAFWAHSALTADIQASARCPGVAPTSFYWKKIAPHQGWPMNLAGRPTNLLKHQSLPVLGGGDIAYVNVTNSYTIDQLECWSASSDVIALYSLGMMYIERHDDGRAMGYLEASAKSKKIQSGTDGIDNRFKGGLPAAHYALAVLYINSKLENADHLAEMHLIAAAEGGSVAAWSRLLGLEPISQRPR